MESKVRIANLCGGNRRKALDTAVKQLLRSDEPGEILFERESKSIFFMDCPCGAQTKQQEGYVTLLAKKMLEVT